MLVLRAGLGASQPLPRDAVARRLRIGVARAAALERRGLRDLGRLAHAGACAAAADGAAGATAAGGASGVSLGDPLTAPATGNPAGSSRPRFGVKGVVASGGADDGSAGGALPPPLGHGSPWTLPILLSLLALVGLLVRRELRRR